MCGIWGLIYKQPRELDKVFFNALGIQNDIRGGDSCGIFIDGKTEYGVEDLKYYSNFFFRSKVLRKTKPVSIALGHCRKASVGEVKESTAQPVVIRDKGGKVEFVLMHNGTIYNYKQLAEKYIPGVDIKGLTDSQVMAGILYRTGYDVLGEYNGGGVFVTVDYRGEEPVVRAFKGASKMTTYAKEAEVERPFYYIKTPDGIAFSSIGPLLKAFYPKSNVFTLQSNKLCYVKNGDFYIERAISRDTCVQTKTYTGYNYNSYDDYNYGSYYGNQKKAGEQKAIDFKKETKEEAATNPTTTKKEEGEVKTYSTYQNSFVNWNDEQGVFMVGTIPAHGKLNVDTFGRIHPAPSVEVHCLGFYQGNLLLKPGLFDYLTKIAKDMDITSKELVEAIPEIISFCSYNPIKDPDSALYKEPTTFLSSMDGVTANFFTGSVVLPFTLWKRTYENGLLIEKEKIESLKEAFRVFLLASNAVTQDTIEDHINTLCSETVYDE